MPLSRRAPLRWKAAIVAGLVAGVVMLIAEMILYPLAFGGSGWDQLRRLAAILFGPDVLASAGSGSFFLGLAIHLVLAVGFTAVLALLVTGLAMPVTAVIGFVAGVVLYFFNFYVSTDVLPWMVDARGWAPFVAHVLFGVTATVVYRLLTRGASRYERIARRPPYQRVSAPEEHRYF